ncbi:hypothetical protein FQA39_LY16777 [Lamprigera yunnana]|nr:hypothetical protein FQA39_LY16777 [Lamprigera yunnana]
MATMCRASVAPLVIVVLVLCTTKISSQQRHIDSDGNLVAVCVIFRHGDRSPFSAYPKDPYNDPSYWPMGYSQLTNIGKMQHFHLGQWLRNRYQNFLNKQFNVSEIRVSSTDTDRTLMSAESNLAGLYPPVNNQVWNPELNWQPIPIHTVPEKMDYLLAMKKPCDKYKALTIELLNSDEFVKINNQNSDLYSYLSENTGRLVNDPFSLQNIYNILFIEESNNLTLPNWTKSVYPSKLKPLSDFSFSISTYTPELIHLKTGPLINEIANHFENATKNISSTRFRMYSAHDTTVAEVLNSLNIFQYHSPPYAATILLELRTKNNNYYLNVFYKNSSDPQKMVLKGCEFDCPLNKFLEIIEPIRITPEAWDFACQSKFLGVLPFNVLQSSVFIVCLSLLFILLSTFIVSLVCARRRRRANVDYMRLPDQEHY